MTTPMSAHKPALAAALINPGPVDDIGQDSAHRAGALNHHHGNGIDDGSGETLMVRPGLDDTLHAIVQVTHEHGLPLRGVHAGAGDVLVFTDAVDVPWWVRWLTDPAVDEPVDELVGARRFVVWAKDSDQPGSSEVAFHVSGRREDIEWTVMAGVPADVAGPVLAEHGVTVTAEHRPIPAAAAVALAEAHAARAAAAAAGRDGRAA